LILLLISAVRRTSASDCLEDCLRNDLQCVEPDVKPYSLTPMPGADPALGEEQ